MPSSRFIAALAAQETSEQVVALVSIDHASLGGPLRYCTGGAAVVSNGRSFTSRGLDVSPPGEGSQSGAASAKLTIDNVEQDTVAVLRSLPTGRPTVTIEAVLAETPDVIEQIWAGLQMTAIRPTVSGIECDLAPRDDGEEEFPLQGFTPGRTPGLF